MRSSTLSMVMGLLFGLSGRMQSAMHAAQSFANVSRPHALNFGGRGKRRKTSQRPSGAAAAKRASKRLRNIAKHQRSAA